MTTPKLVVTDYTFPSLDHEQACATSCGLAFEAHKASSALEVAAAVKGASAVLVQFAPMGADAIAAMQSPGIIVRYGVGFDNIDIQAARAAGHRVCYVPDYCVDEVADHTVAMALSLARRLPALDKKVREGEWSAVETMRPLVPFREQKVGFLGFGRIGSQVWTRLRAFGFKGCVLDPALSLEQLESLDMERAGLQEIARNSDIVFLHLPSSADTRGIIDSEFLGQMKSGAILVNCARGDLIDEAALVSALQNGRIGAAALDVFAQEPLSSDSILRSAPNLILSPHAAWYSDAALSRLQTLATEEITRFFNNEPARCPVPDLVT